MGRHASRVGDESWRGQKPLMELIVIASKVGGLSACFSLVAPGRCAASRYGRCGRCGRCGNPWVDQAVRAISLCDAVPSSKSVSANIHLVKSLPFRRLSELPP